MQDVDQIDKRRKLSFWASINYEASGLVLEVLGKLAILLTALFALYKYNDHLEARRAETTFRYIERHDTGDIAGSRLALANMLEAYERDLLAISTSGISPADASNVIEALLELPENADAKDALNRLDDFYLELNICVEMRTCSRRIVKNYFCPNRANKLWETFGSYFIKRRSIIQDFGKGIERCASYEIRP